MTCSLAAARRVRAAAVLAVVLLTACSGSTTQRGALSATDPPTWAPSPLVGDAAGSAGHPLGVKWDWGRAGSYEPYLKDLAGGSTFYELVWCDVERTRGSRDWTRIDQVVDGAAAVGFRMHLKVRVGSCWATGERLETRGKKEKTASLMPTDLDAYREFVASVVTRYAPRGVHQYAIENEVNGANYWAAGPADFEKLTRVAAEVIRASDPAATVFDSGLSSTAYGAGIAEWLLEAGKGEAAVDAYQRYYARRFDIRAGQIAQADDPGSLRAALEADQAKRNRAYLGATFRLARDGVVDAYQLHFYEEWVNAPLLVEFLRSRLPAGMPIESWETGIFWPDADADDQAIAAEAARTLGHLLAGGVRSVIWLPAAHDPTGRHEDEIRFGLFNEDGSPRRAGLVVLNLARAAAAAAAGAVDAKGLSGLALERGGQTLMLLWSAKRVTVPGPPPEGGAATDLEGGALEWPAAGLPLGPVPILVRLPGGAGQATALLRAGPS